MILHVQQKHIDAALEARRSEAYRPSACCPISQAAREHFETDDVSTSAALLVVHEKTSAKYQSFRHDATHFVNAFDWGQEVGPVTVNLTERVTL